MTGAAKVQPRGLSAIAEDAARRWPLGRIATVGTLLVGLFSVAAIVIGALALGGLSQDRGRVVNTLDPAALRSSQLYSALLNQETGLRGYLLTGQKSFLVPYTMGVASQNAEVSHLRPLLAGMPAAQADLSGVLTAAAHWRSSYAAPAIARVAAAGKPLISPDIAQGKAAFDSLRSPMGALLSYLSTQRHAAIITLRSSVTVLNVTVVVIAVALLLVVGALALGLRTAAIRPLTRLAGDARQVASGDFQHQVDASGPREVHELAIDVNRMRQRILQELSAVQAANLTLQTRARDLERSNAELEQFAYVASHDLQEPLRKVASFCQLLQRRYVGQLDARADQYIEFAVDGAKRMQALIDDLLAFSRVGRADREPVFISCATALSQARVNLAGEIKRSGATVEAAELPSVRAELSLITSLFQNLISNAIKFRSDQAPVVQVWADRADGYWLFSVADNGIGVEPEYADRIFVIFQRLHDRTAYAGTGIGLAMCRKIVEHYGGQIWLDTSFTGGAKFCFTLPVAVAADEGEF
ncbi:MAG TPA: ATP-binding protein [Streptosporangiaceae bacterium]|jgi:signal transduction histidine kinase